MTQEEYVSVSRDARRTVLRLIYEAQVSHIGSNFSCVDIMTTIFDRIDLDVDRFVLSKGWAAASLYYFLWRHSRITKEELDSFCKEGSKFIGLAEPIIPDIPIAGGSMGVGFPGAVGLALAKKYKKEPGMVYCVMSDGEQDCGTTWESAAIAAHHKLDNLVVFVDVNRFQAMGKTHDILNMSPLDKKWESFGWAVESVDGHNFQKLNRAMDMDSPKPTVVICHTIKGKGVSFMENNLQYHYKQLSQVEYENGMKELST